MTKLKTLKDMPYRNYPAEGYISPTQLRSIETSIHTSIRDDLRQEAIKWIKKIHKQECMGFVGDINITPCDEYSCHAVPDFIMHFFNITEADLR